MSCTSCVALTGDCLVIESEAFTPSASAYSINDVLGTLITLDGVNEGTKSGYIQSIEIFEEATSLQKPSFDLFVANYDYTSESDNSAFVYPTLSSVLNVVTRYTLNDWTDIDSVSTTKYSVNSAHGLKIPFTSSSSGSLFANLIIGAVKTYPADSEITVRVTIKVNNS